MDNTLYKKGALFLSKTALFLVPFIPLYVSRSLFFPYITGKAFVFRFLVELAFVAWIFLVVFYKEYRPKKSSLLICLGIFILILIASTIFAVNPSRAFWSNFERMEGLITHLHLFAYFLVLAHVFTKKDWFNLFSLFVVAGFFENLYALTQRLGYISSPQGGFRVDGTIGNPTYLAAYLIFIVAFSAMLWFWTEDKMAKYFYSFVGLFSLLTIYFTATRGAVLALIVGGILAAILYLIFGPINTDKEKYYKKLVSIFLILLIISPIGFWFVKDAEFIKERETLNRFATTYDDISEFVSNIFSGEAKTNAQARTYIWAMSLEAIKEKPLLGWGLDNYNVVFSKYYRSELYSKEPWFDRSHNIFLDWAVSAGIPGLLAYLSLFISSTWMLWRLFKKGIMSLKFVIILSVLLLVYLIQNIFVFDQLATYIAFFAVLAFIHNLFISNSETFNKAEKSLLDFRDSSLVATILLVIFILTVYFINVVPFLSNYNLLSALKYQNNDPQRAFNFYQKAISYNSLGNQEIREQLTRFANTAGLSNQLSGEFEDRVLRFAISETERGIEESPLDPRAYLFAGTMYNSVGLYDRALEVFQAASELSPLKQQIYFEIANVYSAKGEFDKAIYTMEKAVAISPSYNEAVFNLVAIYILNNQPEKGDGLLIETFGKTEVADRLLIQAYSKIRDNQRLIRTWKVFIKGDPDNFDYRKGLIQTYFAAGDMNLAISELERAIEDFPSFAPEGENLIQQIKNQ